MREITPCHLAHPGVEAAFRQCIAHIEAAIRERPAAWEYWPITSDQVDLGLLAPAEMAETVSVPADAGLRGTRRDDTSATPDMIESASVAESGGNGEASTTSQRVHNPVGWEGALH